MTLSDDNRQVVQMAECEKCGLKYPLDEIGSPETEQSYTCDDCGGYVDVRSINV